MPMSWRWLVQPRAGAGSRPSPADRPVKGYSLTVPVDGWNDPPQMAVVDEVIGLVPLGNRMRLAGSAEFTGADLTLNPRRSDYIWQTALTVYPALGRHVDPDRLSAGPAFAR